MLSQDIKYIFILKFQLSFVSKAGLPAILIFLAFLDINQLFMIIKKIGYLLLIRLKLFSLLAKLAPMAIVMSFFMIYFTSHFKQSNQIQEPSLRTKLQNVRTFKGSLPLNYTPIYQGISYIQIPGALQHECMLLTFHKEHEQSVEIKNIYQTLSKGYNPKSIILLSYRDVQALQQFFSWYYNPERNIEFSFGIIRVGLNIGFQHQIDKAKEGSNDTKNKAYFDIYSPELHVDLDYYSAINQLLAVTLFATSPCKQLQREPLKLIRKGFLAIARYITGKDDFKVFADHVLCEFHHHFNHSLTVHEVMMTNGFQAGSVIFLVAEPQKKKAEQVVVSFLREFSLQQDHLHSASDFYYIISRTQHLPILGFLISSIIFTIGISICILNRFIKNHKIITLQIPSTLLVICLVWLWEESLHHTNRLTVVVAIICLGLAICKELYRISTQKIAMVQHTYAEFTITMISALISIFFGLLCYSLSIMTMLTTTLLLLKPRQAVLRVVFKLAILCVILIVAVRIQELQPLNLPSYVFQGLMKLSKRMGVILIVMMVGLCM